MTVGLRSDAPQYKNDEGCRMAVGLRSDAPRYKNDVGYVTVTINDHLFGLPIDQVRDVFVLSSISVVPLSPGAVVGLLNLRGSIVTILDMRRCMQLPDLIDHVPNIAVGVEYHGEPYGLLVDTVGEVLHLPDNGLERNPGNMDREWSRMTSGIRRLDDRLMIVLDVKRVLDAGVGAVTGDCHGFINENV